MLGDKIKKLRTKNQLTQKQLAEKLGLAQSTIGMIESGKRDVSFEILIKIADLFNVSTDFLLGVDSDQIKEEVALYETGEFKTPQAAMHFILKQPSIMGFGGFDTSKMSDEEIMQFANELLNQLKLLGYKYKK